ncbi:hypothetical protein CU669_17555 [Paramagnetospirillum kuznetsovii]|uniref:Uncharacterized protein n=1 Tax=Paramagnetospirillum kuznetsovii TaxID=2053833 RepID=A0A364NU91_9PROT|nr:hypothetical protein [Paramagnetospirillum kuznetsovii]RAU20636.1 hypothetical protein CU669_17555 [Paramagnetospirillum kuznetsovii]
MKKIAGLLNMLVGAFVLPYIFLALLPADVDEVAPDVGNGFWGRGTLTGVASLPFRSDHRHLQ